MLSPEEVGILLIHTLFLRNQFSKGKMPLLNGYTLGTCVYPVLYTSASTDSLETFGFRPQMVATGVCHTDLYHIFEGMHKDGFPVVLGHEGAGIVESVGAGVSEFKPGQDSDSSCR